MRKPILHLELSAHERLSPIVWRALTLIISPLRRPQRLAALRVQPKWWNSTGRHSLENIPFTEYEYNSLTIKAAAELTKLSAFRGPRIHGEVTPATLFRGNTPADLSGPYLSQFLLKSFQYGATPFLQRIRTAVPELNYMTGYSEWLSVQNGAKPGLNKFDLTSRYIGSSRDLAAFVREDFTYQAFLNACLILLGMHAEFDMGNPYMESRNQSAFSTFGPPHVNGDV